MNQVHENNQKTKEASLAKHDQLNLNQPDVKNLNGIRDESRNSILDKSKIQEVDPLIRQGRRSGNIANIANKYKSRRSYGNGMNRKSVKHQKYERDSDDDHEDNEYDGGDSQDDNEDRPAYYTTSDLLYSVFYCNNSKGKPSRRTAKGRNVEFNQHMKMLDQERDIVQMIDSVNTIKDKIGTIIDKITQIDTDHQSLMGQLLRSTNLSSKATTVSLKTKYNKKLNMQNFTNSIRQDLAPVKMIYENEIPTKEHEHDKSSLHEEEKHSSQYNTHLSKSKKSNYQLQDNSLMSQILNEIEPRENHKENIKSINKIVDHEMQDLSKSKPKIKKRTKKAAVVPNNEVASNSSVSQSDNQNLDESSHEHLQAPHLDNHVENGNVFKNHKD